MAPERRRFAGAALVVASHNPGKVGELRALLSTRGVRAVPAASLGLAEPEETGATFAENALAKALPAARAAALPALGDDSGLAVTALDGAPGIFSARWAGPERDFAAAMARVHDELAARGAATPADRRAEFVAALCLAWPDGHVEAFEGRIGGTLVWPPRGTNGFGYDPIFVADGHERTFGEMTPDRKQALNHRGRAFALLAAACLPEPAGG